MTGPAGRWLIAIAGSGAVHAVLYLIFALTYQPDPVQQQKSPQSKLDIQAFELDRVPAREHQPQKDDAAPLTPDSPLASSEAVPRTEVLPAPSIPAKDLTATQAVPVAVRPSTETPATQTSAQITPDPVMAASQPTERIDLATAPLDTLGAVSVRLAPTGTVSPPTVPAQLKAADALPVRPSALSASVAPITEQTPQKITAALAFDGASDGEIDPVSLAAFQSFTRPGDIDAESDQLRDGLATLLAQVPCARLQVVFEPETATLRVQGHIPEAGLRGPVLSALQARMGDDIGVSDDILILPRPQCGALTGIATVGLPQSTDQITNPLLIGQDTQARVLDFVAGDRLFFDLTAPDYDAYVYVDYFDAEGNVLHLVPNDLAPLDLINAKTSFRVGATDAGLQIFIGPPYGQEIAVAFAASAPLYDEPRPLVEPAEPYLQWLRSRVDSARAQNPDFKGEWVYFFVTTAVQ